MELAFPRTLITASFLTTIINLGYAEQLGGGNDHGNTTSSLAVGPGAETWEPISTAVGVNARTLQGADRSTAIGYRATVGEDANFSTAVGFDANIGAGATHSTAVGRNSRIGAGAHHSSAFGNDSAVGANSFGASAFGEASRIGANSQYSTTVGHRAVVGTENPNGAVGGIAIGDFANVQADEGIALGRRARVNVINSAAIGSGSVANIGAETDYEAFGLVEQQNSIGEVAVGGAAGERVITGVAAGSRGHDAVNVMQLRAVDSFAVKYDEAAPGTPDYTQITLGQGAVGDAPVLIGNVQAGAISSTLMMP